MDSAFASFAWTPIRHNHIFFFLSLFLPVSLCAFQVHLTNRMNTLYTAHITFTFLILTSIMYTFVYSKKKLCSSEVFLSFLTVTTFPTAIHIKLTCRMLYCWYLTQFLRQQALFCTYILTCNKQSNALFYQQTWNKVRILKHNDCSRKHASTTSTNFNSRIQTKDTVYSW
jgi:hypothetical protein